MTSVIGCGNPERGFFRRWIEIAAAEQPIQPRQRSFEFMQKTLSLGSGFISRRTPDEQVVVEHVSQPLQRAAHGRLTEQQARCSSCDIPFFRKNCEHDQQIEVSLA
jgi:hypothetical protein